MSIITRFAPSPTGKLHIGNTRTAIINFLYARKHKGTFILRIDDTDRERSKEAYTHEIMNDLTWLGLKWDLTFKQSSRLARYQEVKELLINEGRLYACYETPEELEIKRKSQLSSSLPPIYDRKGLYLTAQEKAQYEKQGRRPHYRFLINHQDIKWHDLIKEDISFAGKDLSDPIVVREDGNVTYLLSSVIDDVDYHITHILRGEDHITNTATQLQMFEALKANKPKFGHLSLLKTQEGKISKRIGGSDLEALRIQNCVEPMSIVNLLTFIGSSKPITSYKSLEEVLNVFDVNAYSSNPVNYDIEELLNLNNKLLASSDFTTIKPRLQELGLDISEQFWLAVRANLSTLNDIKLWYQICYQPKLNIEVDTQLLKTAAELLPAGEPTADTWKIWTELLKAKTNLKGKELFAPLRMALTGLESGFELSSLLPLLSRQEILKRLGSGE